MISRENLRPAHAVRRGLLACASLLALSLAQANAQPSTSNRTGNNPDQPSAGERGQYVGKGADNAAGTPGPREASDQGSNDLVARGRYLATVGDCVACHTVDPGKPFAGGLYMNTPFGQIPTPNITPDKETGIGNWTDDQFYRAFHEGVDDQGHNLYPAFPYLWFTHVTKDDVLAIKAYLFSLTPIHQPNKPLHLVFPFNIRAALGPWNALYFHPGTFKPDTSKSAEWNRGAYLAEGLGHCSDCHTPKNVAMAPIRQEAYAGGEIDHWYAPNLTSDMKEGLGAWSVNDIVQYLKTGQARGKTVAIGPMSQTIHDSTSHLSDQDLHAIAVYLKSLPAHENYKLDHTATAAVAEGGQQVYASYCAQCHGDNGQGMTGAVPALASNGAVTAKGPQDVIRAVLGGLAAQSTFSPMPGFATVLSPDQIAAVANYVRTAWGNGAPANATGAMVSELAPQTRTMMAGTLNDKCTKLGNDKLDQAIEGESIQSLLHATHDVNMINQITKMVDELKKTDPQAQQSQIINALTAGYCPIVVADRRIPPEEKAPRLDQFSELVYTQISDHGKK